MFAEPSAFLVTLKSPIEVAGSVLAVRATIQPAFAVSVWVAGTGVNAKSPPASRFCPIVIPTDAGHALPDGGFATATTSEPRCERPSKTLTPISPKWRVVPSFGQSGKSAPSAPGYPHPSPPPRHAAR